ncbi:hypothetical protein L7F22_038693 [Adiantum nelumboides]|nr:hypothetical protein [Adiantum nelumboides]
MLFDMSRTEDALRSCHLLNINSNYLSHEVFRQMVVTAIYPLFMHAHADIEFAWYSFVVRMQSVIQDFGIWYLGDQRRALAWAKQQRQCIMESDSDILTVQSVQELLCEANHVISCNQMRKVYKWQLRSYCLNFHRRATHTSVKNFQLVTEFDNEHILLQLGKVSDANNNQEQQQALKSELRLDTRLFSKIIEHFK